MKNHDRPTIVTAFFDIGRASMDYANCEPRSFERYLSYFEGWARIKNNLIIYAQKGLGDRILAVRKRFGLGDKTKIVEIEDVFSIESDLLSRMEDIEKDKNFLNFRYFSSEISNTARYNYIMLMKYYFLKDASEKYVKDGVLVWVDLGFNHGGDCYTRPEEFDFELKCELGLEKVQLFVLPGKNIDSISPIRSLQYQMEHLQGAPIVCPASRSAELYSECIKAMNALLMIGCIDDDQQLLLMSYRSNPGLFDIRKSFWFMPIKEYLGGDHLSVNPAFLMRANGAQPRASVRKRIRRAGRVVLKKTNTQRFLARQKKIAEEEWPNR